MDQSSDQNNVISGPALRSQTFTNTYQPIQTTSSNIIDVKLDVNVVNPLNQNITQVQNTTSTLTTVSPLPEPQGQGQISLVNFHQHFNNAAGATLDTTSNQGGHNYVSIMRNKIVSSTPISTTVPEFLYQLTKMLTDNNKEVIEWANGKISHHYSI